MITGEFSEAAVSNTALMVLDPITFTAGRAYPFSLAWLKIACTSSPVATPGFMLWDIIFVDYVYKSS
jgi:hypothetical protein